MLVLGDISFLPLKKNFGFLLMRKQGRCKWYGRPLTGLCLSGVLEMLPVCFLLGSSPWSPGTKEEALELQVQLGPLSSLPSAPGL